MCIRDRRHRARCCAAASGWPEIYPAMGPPGGAYVPSQGKIDKRCGESAGGGDSAGGTGAGAIGHRRRTPAGGIGGGRGDLPSGHVPHGAGPVSYTHLYRKAIKPKRIRRTSTLKRMDLRCLALERCLDIIRILLHNIPLYCITEAE